MLPLLSHRNQRQPLLPRSKDDRVLMELCNGKLELLMFDPMVLTREHSVAFVDKSFIDLDFSFLRDFNVLLNASELLFFSS